MGYEVVLSGICKVSMWKVLVFVPPAVFPLVWVGMERTDGGAALRKTGRATVMYRCTGFLENLSQERPEEEQELLSSSITGT